MIKNIVKTTRTTGGEYWVNLDHVRSMSVQGGVTVIDIGGSINLEVFETPQTILDSAFVGEANYVAVTKEMVEMQKKIEEIDAKTKEGA